MRWSYFIMSDGDGKHVLAHNDISVVFPPKFFIWKLLISRYSW